MTIEAVIGANYGDEGKGLFTEHLCRNRPNPLVVMSNGGCQRGHTVNNVEKGIRHVFNHFGSGSLLRTPTTYSKSFLLNPIKYVEEKHEFEKLGISTIALRAPDCLLQLPSDMFINQAIEKARGFGRHGSCGWGIWETNVRNENYSRLTFNDFASFDYAKKKSTYLECLEWQLENRLCGVCQSAIDENLSYVKNDSFIKHFIQDFEEMEKSTKSLDSNKLLEIDWIRYGIDVGTMIVENAQGLLLDKKYAPLDENGRTDIHTTPSKCGLDGVLEALNSDINCELTLNYISRTYFTRHGNGPFPEESKNLHFEDKTNIFNQYQGNLRFGKMSFGDVIALRERIEEDSNGNLWKIAFTHCNEIDFAWRSIFSKNVYCSHEDDSRKITLC